MRAGGVAQTVRMLPKKKKPISHMIVEFHISPVFLSVFVKETNVYFLPSVYQTL
jgi:hypothetical protein